MISDNLVFFLMGVPAMSLPFQKIQDALAHSSHSASSLAGKQGPSGQVQVVCGWLQVVHVSPNIIIGFKVFAELVSHKCKLEQVVTE